MSGPFPSALTFDLIAYFDWVGVGYNAHSKNQSADWIGIRCLWCDDPSDHLGVRKDWKAFNCQRCQRHGKLHNLIRMIEGIDYPVALERISQFQTGIAPETTQWEIQERAVLPKPGQHILPAAASKDFRQAHYDYLSKRGFDPEKLIDEWNLYAVWLEDYKLRYRIIAPITDEHLIVSYTARDITDKALVRYMACPKNKAALPRREQLYGLDKASTIAVIVEGPADAWKVGRGAVASLGTGISNIQIMKLARRKLERYYILFDSEELAQTKAVHVMNRLDLLGCKAEVIEIGDKDPGEMSPDDALHLRTELGL